MNCSYPCWFWWVNQHRSCEAKCIFKRETFLNCFQTFSPPPPPLPPEHPTHLLLFPNPCPTPAKKEKATSPPLLSQWPSASQTTTLTQSHAGCWLFQSYRDSRPVLERWQHTHTVLPSFCCWLCLTLQAGVPITSHCDLLQSSSCRLYLTLYNVPLSYCWSSISYCILSYLISCLIYSVVWLTVGAPL